MADNIVWDDDAGIVWDDAPSQPKPQSMEQLLGPSDFTKAFASTPARILKSAMQMVGAGDYVPEAVSNAAAQGDASMAGRIVGDIAGTGGIRAGVGGLSSALQSLNAAKGGLPALARVAEAGTYGGAQGAITSPDDQTNAAKWGAVGGAAGPLVAPAAGSVARLLGNTAAQGLGLSTGAGAGAVKQAFKGGEDFVANMRGKVPAADVVEQARAGVQSMRKQMHDAYTADKTTWAAGQQPLDFAPVVQAYQNVEQSLTHNGQWKIGPSEQNVMKQIHGVLTDFMSNPTAHTTEGFDALKQRLAAIYPESPAHRQAQRAVSSITSAVRDTITAQNPTYAKAMKDYWQRSSQLDEIERSLSLGDKATIDTTLRKLQSLTRNNASTNYGQRLASAEALAAQGGEDVMPALAGQAMNDWLPRGLQRGVSAGAGTLGVASGVVGIPAAIGAGLVQSPRVVGEVSNAAGQAWRAAQNRAVIEALRRGAPSTIRQANQDEQ